MKSEMGRIVQVNRTMSYAEKLLYAESDETNVLWIPHRGFTTEINLASGTAVLTMLRDLSEEEL